MATASVVIPVKDGVRYLREVLDAVLAEGPDEVLVIDSGSTDGSVQIARHAGVPVLEIEPARFGHGRTRNLGVEETTGELILFLTQDATPVPGWLAAHREAIALADRVGASYGPHLPRPDTSPMIARELEEFFATHSPEGGPAVQREGDTPFLSNVNACYRRDCWEQIRFDDVPYSEDQAFGRAMLEAGWAKAFHPDAAVLHAHDYPALQFMRRYFDEYRGLRQSLGHVERLGVRSAIRHVRGGVAGDRRWMRERGFDPRRQAEWTLRSAAHHGGRKVFSALGSRGHRLPEAVQKRISLEGTAVALPHQAAGHVEPSGTLAYEEVLEIARDGAAPLMDAVPRMAEREHYHFAVLIPPFRRGSGGHNSIFQMVSRLEAKGHLVTVWVNDPLGWQASEWPAVVRRNVSDYFAQFKGPVYKDFSQWHGADVVVATGWDTVHRALTLDQCLARAYVVHDHEPEFHPTGAQRAWAEQTYSFGLHTICASPWLAGIVRERYGGSASLFDFGVDHDVYHPRPVERRRDTVVFYARDVTPRRAVPLGLLALQELKARRPDLRIVTFGDLHPTPAPFDQEHLGIVSPERLAQVYSEATVGLVLSMTNYSLIPQEMLACGLPCVDLAGFSAETVFGADGPVELAGYDPVEIADACERLLDDGHLWDRRSKAGMEFVADRTWDRAAEQLEEGLREALRLREREFATHEPGQIPVGAVAPGAAPTHGFDASARAVDVEFEPRRRLATSRVIERLDPSDLDAIRAALTADELELLDAASPTSAPRTLLALGVWHRIPGVLEKTGLRPDQPPEEVHAMARGPMAAGGAFYEADLVAEAVAEAGEDVARIGAGLDFGCSSGRVLRALGAAWPGVEWHGCDPNAAAIEWASEHVGQARFEVSPTDPPLPYADGAFGLVYAISIWSHYNDGAAVRWLEEMRRIIRPGGLLVITTHGYTSVAVYGHEGARPPRQLEQIRRALYRRGFWFADEFGPAGDHGVRHPDWGSSFMTPEWLLARVSRDWTVEHFGPGQNAGNQDLYVLRRR